jgi:Alpha/beta hydrolase domain
MTRRAILFTALTILAAAAPASARVTLLRIDRTEPFAPGVTFGMSGAYERVIGVAKGELDPADLRNAGIVGLARAPRNAAGKVEYQTDLFILRPVDPAKGNHHLLFEVLNRGNKLMVNRLNELAPAADTNDPSTAEDAGDGFLFRQGYAIAWAGWDPDSPTRNHGMIAHIPALPDMAQEIRDEFVSQTRAPAMTKFNLSYTAAGLDQPAARLTVRQREADPETVVPADKWHFIDARSVELLPTGTTPAPGVIYEFTYKARAPWVSGIGFAIQRDIVAFLRANKPDDAGVANPAGGAIHATIGFGISQSSRFLRDFIAHGFNQDEAGHKVFDGVLGHIGGIGTVFLNDLYAEPFRTRTQHEDHTMPENSFPFSAAVTRDPVSGRSGSMLRQNAFDPKLIETNTDAEYWQKGASLLGTDPQGEHDLALPATTRLYLISGSQHTGRYGATDARGPCANLRNPHDPYPALRALLVALDGWVAHGTQPPASRLPRLADGTLVAFAKLGFPALPGMVPPGPPDAIDAPGDWVHPMRTTSPYAPLVPAVDADGNARAGLRLPDISVPLATYTGWNRYAAPFPVGEACDRDGSSLGFAATDTARTAGDPRRSLAGRYGSRAHYVALVEAAASVLVLDRFLLPEDAALYVARARDVPDF